jgi:hypothetical protein
MWAICQPLKLIVCIRCLLDLKKLLYARALILIGLASLCVVTNGAKTVSSEECLAVARPRPMQRIIHNASVDRIDAILLKLLEQSARSNVPNRHFTSVTARHENFVLNWVTLQHECVFGQLLASKLCKVPVEMLFVSVENFKFACISLLTLIVLHDCDCSDHIAARNGPPHSVTH